MTNKLLVKKYPFLQDPEYPKYNYFDDLPIGWRKAFGLQLCNEIMQSLEEENCVETYRVNQVKEKFGELRWYDSGATNKISFKIIPKYERLSARTCIKCGRPATKLSTDWILPWCDKCAPREGTYTNISKRQ